MWFARLAGVVSLAGAFYTTTYITSYPHAVPAFAAFGLVTGWVGSILALALPRSKMALTTAAVLVGIGFLGAVVGSGIAFGPGMVMLIVAARRADRAVEPVDFTPSVSGGFRTNARYVDDVTALAPPVGVAQEWDRLVELPQTEERITLPEAEPAASNGSNGSSPATSTDGRIQAGPPGVIGVLGPSSS
jgi:hypothetical protein